MQRRIDVDFTAGTVAVNGAPAGATGATVGGFVAALNAALGASGTASFANGVLRLDATTAGTGFVFDEPATGGSQRGEKTFAQFFGLNDLVRTGAPSSQVPEEVFTDSVCARTSRLGSPKLVRSRMSPMTVASMVTRAPTARSGSAVTVVAYDADDSRVAATMAVSAAAA